MAYNLSSAGGNVRIGNWQEELILEKTTGIRFAPDPTDRSTQLLTKSRVIDHTDRMPTSEYKSNTQLTVQDPRKHKDYIPPKKSAPRKLLLEQKLLRQADEEKEYETAHLMTEKMQPQFATTNRTSFQKEGFNEGLVMDNPDVKIQTYSKNYCTETATTYYYHTVTKGNRSLNFPVSYINSTTNPFKKSLAFSSDIRDPLARRAETNENPKPFAKVKDYRMLKIIRDKIIHNKNNVSLHDIIKILWSGEEDASVTPAGVTGMISLTKVVNILASKPIGLSLSAEEVACLDNALVAVVPPPTTAHTGYGRHTPVRNNLLSIVDLVIVLRGDLSPHQQEIIQIVFDKLDSVGKGYVTREDLERAYNFEECKSPLTMPKSNIPLAAPTNRIRTGAGNASSICFSPEVDENTASKKVFSPGLRRGANASAQSSNTIDYASLYIMDSFDELLRNLQITFGNDPATYEADGKESECDDVNDEGRGGTAELFDFIEYYWNISAAIDGNEVMFEKLIRKQWKFHI